MESTSLREPALVFLAGILLVVIANTLRRTYLRSVRHLRGPPSDSFLSGNFRRLEDPETIHQLVGEYGHNFVFRGLFQAPGLFTTDLRTINHILTHSMDYHKPDSTHRSLGRVLGQGVLVAEGEKHRQQRRVMNPAFGPAQIRELSDIFVEKAIGLCEFWNDQIAEQGGSAARVNALDGLSKMTLDVIGLAGFDYKFEALNTELPPNELNQAFHAMFKERVKEDVWTLLANRFPKATFLRDKRLQKVDEAQVVMKRIAEEIFRERRAEVLYELGKSGTGYIEKNSMQGRNLLTLLIKANMATDIPENQRMTDEEVLSQIPTFLVAGHETTSTATAWCLYALTQTPRVQQKLREEILTVDTDTPSMEELQLLPYLDQVVHETLRLHAPVSLTARVAIKDDVLPVSSPIIDRYGKVQNELHISTGTTIILPIVALNTSRALWGDDALEFRPERWSSLPAAVAAMPGVWGHLLTFLGGPHACIGYRFSIAELKALLFTLIRNFEFELAVPKEDISNQGAAIKRPYVVSEAAKGAQLPLIIRPYVST